MARCVECTFHYNCWLNFCLVDSSLSDNMLCLASDVKYIFLYVDEITHLVSPDGIFDIAQNGHIIVMNDIQWLEY